MNRDIPQNNREKRFEQLRLKRKRDKALAYDDYVVPVELIPFLKSLAHSERKRFNIGKIQLRSD